VDGLEGITPSQRVVVSRYIYCMDNRDGSYAMRSQGLDNSVQNLSIL